MRQWTISYQLHFVELFDQSSIEILVRNFLDVVPISLANG